MWLALCWRHPFQSASPNLDELSKAGSRSCEPWAAVDQIDNEPNLLGMGSTNHKGRIPEFQSAQP
jgi:hypothetical protein